METIVRTRKKIVDGEKLPEKTLKALLNNQSGAMERVTIWNCGDDTMGTYCVESTMQPDILQQNKHNYYQKLQQPNSSEVGENYDKKAGNTQTSQGVEPTMQPDILHQNKHNNYQELLQPNSSEVGQNYDREAETNKIIDEMIVTIPNVNP